MIMIGKAIWETRLSKAFININPDGAYWSLYIKSGPLVEDPYGLELSPSFYSDYFAPLSEGSVLPFSSFNQLTIQNGDDFQGDDGICVFGCFVGTHETTSKNRLLFGNGDNQFVDLRWCGEVLIEREDTTGIFPFLVECKVAYAGVQAKNMDEERVRSLLASIDPTDNRSYNIEYQATGVFRLLPS